MSKVANTEAKPQQASMPRQAKTIKSRYITSLDGLRALAVIAVLLYHLGVPWLKGGLLGVTVFFVLSGFLITSLLLLEIRKTHSIDLKKFWSRRLKRIIPAVATCVIVTAAACTFFSHPLLTKMRGDVIPSLLFVNNWWQIFNDISYFDALGAPSPLTHLWSLAVEMQFYIVWPLALLFFVKKNTSKSSVRRMLVILSLLSAVEMAILYNPTVDPSRVYYGTDTRAFSLLLGAALAFVLPLKTFVRLPEDEDDASSQVFNKDKVIMKLGGTSITLGMTEAGGFIAMVGLIIMMIFTNGYTAFPYYGGLVLCTILSAVLLTAIVQRGSLLGKALSAKPLAWLGTRSYGLYLWHYPILLLTTPQNLAGSVPLWARALQLILIVVVTEISYRFVEEPIRRNDFENPKAALRLAVCLLIVSVIAVGGLIFVPDTNILSDEGTNLIHGEVKDPDAEDTKESSSYDILMIGDSVSLRLVDPFDDMFPHGHLDAKVSRQFSAAFELLEYYQSKNLVGPVVVYALGTNGLASTDSIEELIKKTGNDPATGKPVEIFFVNTRSHTDWVDSMNSNLASVCDKHDNAHLIDWYSRSAGNNDLFDGDGTHLGNYGSRIYMQMLMDAVYKYLPERSQTAALESLIPDALDDVVSTNDAQNTLNNAATAMADSLTSTLSLVLNPKEEK